jgi:type 2 lantibiotic biosynthesis protein LanM
LTYLGSLWNDASILEEAEAIVDLLPPLIAKDTAFDFMIGSAGCLASLLTLYRRTHSEKALAAALQCGEHLLKGAQPMQSGVAWPSPIHSIQPLTGFSHGAAGVAWALMELAAATGQERFHTLALAGLAYEQSLFSDRAGGWPDFRSVVVDGLPDPSQQAFTHFWCHGTAGIGLSRLSMLAHLDGELVEQDIEQAITQTVRHGFGSSHCLCHGDLGNLELLLLAGQRLNKAELVTQTYQMATAILDDAEAHGWRCGVPMGVETPGLMTGLAGIGYGLLRLAEPAVIPSVLLLDLPIQDH